MPRWWTPARRRGVELLDDPGVSDPVRARAMRDVARSNALFGGTRAAVGAALRAAGGGDGGGDGAITLLDVATGTGDIPPRIAAALRRRRPARAVVTLGLDRSASLLRDARPRLDAAVAADALRIPLRDDSVDLVLCSQFLHHMPGDDAVSVVRELHRVARHGVLLSDLRRSWLAAAGFWLAATLLRFHAVTRHDGVVSVLRGFTPGELRVLVRRATGVEPRVTSHVFWRIVATWRKAPARGVTG